MSQLNKKTFLLLFIIFLLFNFAQCKQRAFLQNQVEKCYDTLDNYIIYLNTECLIGSQIDHKDAKLISGKSLNQEMNFNFPSVYHFWFIECPPCIAEIPGLNKLMMDYKKVNYVSICKNEKEGLKKFLSGTNFDFNHVENGKEFIKENFFEAAYPMTIIASKENKIIDIIVGGRTDSLASKDIYDKIQAILLKLEKEE